MVVAHRVRDHPKAIERGQGPRIVVVISRHQWLPGGSRRFTYILRDFLEILRYSRRFVRDMFGDSSQRSLDILGYSQIFSDILRDSRIFSDILRNSQRFSDILRYSQILSEILRCS